MRLDTNKDQKLSFDEYIASIIEHRSTDIDETSLRAVRESEKDSFQVGRNHHPCNRSNVSAVCCHNTTHNSQQSVHLPRLRGASC